MKEKIKKIRELLDEINYYYRAGKTSAYTLAHQKIIEILNELEEEE